jgi:hypothetical protein
MTTCSGIRLEGSWGDECVDCGTLYCGKLEGNNQRFEDRWVPPTGLRGITSQNTTVPNSSVDEGFLALPVTRLSSSDYNGKSAPSIESHSHNKGILIYDNGGTGSEGGGEIPHVKSKRGFP